jgi:putative spermidine/putrescine transport system ATP-binding protein
MSAATANNSAHYLQLTNIRKLFGSAVAVDHFDLNIPKGEFVAFLGPSGCGKTTVLRMVAGFETPSAGAIILDGQDITAKAANQRNIGMVFQSYALFPNMNVADNIKFGLKVRGVPAAEQRQRLDEMLIIIKLQDFAGRFPHQLSGGQQQRVALARALAIRPQVLLLDEPLSALDAKIRVSVREEIRAIQRQLGITTIFVTHDQEEAMSISDRIVVMNKGRIDQVGKPPEIYNAPKTQFVASFIGSLNVLQASVGSREAQQIVIDGQALRVDENLPATNEFAVTIRPEAVQINADLNGTTNHLRGVVDDVYFLGSIVRVRVRLQGQALNVDTFNNPNATLPQIGDAVDLSVAPTACKVLADSASAN